MFGGVNDCEQFGAKYLFLINLNRQDGKQYFGVSDVECFDNSREFAARPNHFISFSLSTNRASKINWSLCWKHIDLILLLSYGLDITGSRQIAISIEHFDVVLAIGKSECVNSVEAGIFDIEMWPCCKINNHFEKQWNFRRLALRRSDKRIVISVGWWRRCRITLAHNFNLKLV